MKYSNLLWVVLLFFLLDPLEASELRIPSLLGDHMVLQRDTMVNIWGWAGPGDTVKVLTGWDTRVFITNADDNGDWLIQVETIEAGGPFKITIEADTILEINDILLGEVWICGGQSNMEMALSKAQSAAVEIPVANYPEIRFFNVEKRISSLPREDVDGAWTSCTPSTAADFSAVAYFFGKNLYRDLGIPIGLVNSTWGGTPSEAWTSKEALRSIGGFNEELSLLNQTSDVTLDIIQETRDSIIRIIAIQRDFRNPKNPGFSGKWMKSSMDDSEWISSTAPAGWSTLPEIGMVEGVVWLRKSIIIPETWIGKSLVLELGPIDEMDATYYNGRKVGSSLKKNDWDKDRKYKIPSILVSEKECVLAIRVVNTLTEGGLFGNPEQLRIYPEGDDINAISLAGSWKYKVAHYFPELPPMANPKTPTVLYNGMLYPLSKFAIKGVIWYQGEDNVGRAVQYRKIFPALITDWRSAWGRGDFPFYFVQIGPFKYGYKYSAAELREAQLLTLSVINNAGMAVTLDIGNPKNINPTNKRDVGKRLALWALANDYGRDLVFSGPLYKGQTIEGNQIRILFDHSGSGLVIKDGPLTHIEIAGENQIYLPGDARIDGNTILVGHPQIKEPVAVRYGWENTAEPNLYNREGLPASSFCSDEWPRVTAVRSQSRNRE